jgi:hypothetical protein
MDLNSELNSMVRRIAREVISVCASSYSFDEEEAMLKVGELLSVRLEKKRKPEVGVGESGIEKKQKKFPLPFSGVKEEKWCEGLRQNQHQYTQCESKRMRGEKYCKTCKSQADKNENGLPTYGTIDGRMACGIFDFKDPSGLSPKPYSWVMRKLKLSEAAVEEEAERLGVRLLREHLVDNSSAAKKKDEKKEKGRPKKKTTVVIGDSSSSSSSSSSLKEKSDLFKELAKAAQIEVAKNLPPSPAVAAELMEEDTSSCSSSEEEEEEDDVADALAAKQKAEEEAKRIADDVAAAEAKHKAEEKLKADEQLAAEAKRIADALAAEEKLKADALAAAEVKAAEEKQKADALAAAEEKLKADEQVAAEKKKKEERKKQKALKEAAAKEAVLKEAADKEAAAKEAALKEAADKEAAAKEAALKEAAAKEAALKEAADKEAALKEVKEVFAPAPSIIERVRRVTTPNGVYLRSTTSGIVYTMEKDIVGRWDAKNEKIIFDALSDASSEEEEEEEYSD